MLYKELVVKAVESIPFDESFKACSSPCAKAAITTASKLLDWSSKIENRNKFRTFSNSLIDSLKCCFKKGLCKMLMQKIGLYVHVLVGGKVHRKEEKMWGHYHCYRTSCEFIMLWKILLLNIQEPPSPTFFQHVTDIIFKELMKVEFPVNDQLLSTDIPRLTPLEENALRYVAYM